MYSDRFIGTPHAEHINRLLKQTAHKLKHNPAITGPQRKRAGNAMARANLCQQRGLWDDAVAAAIEARAMCRPNWQLFTTPTQKDLTELVQ